MSSSIGPSSGIPLPSDSYTDVNGNALMSMNDTADDIAKREKQAALKDALRKIAAALSSGDVEAVKSLVSHLGGIELPPGLQDALARLLGADAATRGAAQYEQTSAIERKDLEKALAQVKDADAGSQAGRQPGLMSNAVSFLSQAGAVGSAPLAGSTLDTPAFAVTRV